jgi:hypothetical protein
LELRPENKVNIEKCIETSRKFHGSYSPDTFIQRTYWDFDGYKCAVGCLLEDPESFQEFCKNLGTYRIADVVNDHTLSAYLTDHNEPLLKHVTEDSEESRVFLRKLETLQILHDESYTISEYLQSLEKYEASLKLKE